MSNIENKSILFKNQAEFELVAMDFILKKLSLSGYLDLVKLTNFRITSEAEVLERAKVMDKIMDMAKHENDIVMVFVNAIADRIEEFENDSHEKHT